MSKTNTQTSSRQETWPSEELETVSHCPVCGSEDRQRLLSELTDSQFFTAAGRWNIELCTSCNSGYLNPRPNPASIGRAYAVYYTHSNSAPNSVLGQTKKALANGYRNHRFGTQDKPSTRLGIFYAWIFRGQRATADARMRHLPRAHNGAKVLDVGCGGGDFMALAESAGWDAYGIDLDATAVTKAKSAGLKASLGDIDTLKDMEKNFQVITLSHVLEHVHKPLHLLQSCKRLLSDDGWMWIEVPNFDAPGFKIFGKNWLPLDPPRHLTHFNRASLEYILNQAGFQQVEDLPSRPLCKVNYAKSEAIRAGLGNAGTATWSMRLRNLAKVIKNEWRARSDAKQREFCTVKASR